MARFIEQWPDLLQMYCKGDFVHEPDSGNMKKYKKTVWKKRSASLNDLPPREALQSIALEPPQFVGDGESFVGPVPPSV
jgi:hypothetical protein